MHVIWSAPSYGSLKLNFYATILNKDVGIGAIIRDSNCDVMFSMESHFLLFDSVEQAKAIAMYEALEASITPIKAETDSLII